MSRELALLVTLAMLASPAFAGRKQTSAPAKPPISFAAVNVCERVTGAAVASALKGKLLDVRPVNVTGFPAARCIYGIDIGEARRTFVLWLNPPADYDGLRKAAGNGVTSVPGIGDAAHMTVDPDSKRFTLTAMSRDKVAIQVTGEQADWVQAIAKLTLSTF